MKRLFILISFFSLAHTAQAKIEDNSFLLEEAYNQEYGVYQFIQAFKAPLKHGNTYEYSFENEIPITDKVHQASYVIPMSKAASNLKGGIGDIILNYRWQPLNKNGFLLAERFGLIIPTGSITNERSSGVYGIEFMHAGTLPINNYFISHFNLGFKTFPNSKRPAPDKDRTTSSFLGAASVIYLTTDNFNILLEAVVESTQKLTSAGEKTSEAKVTLNPGIRFAINTNWLDTQIVPGISFPISMLNSKTDLAALAYLSIEPKFY